MHPEQSIIGWHPACRIIPSRFPTVNLFDRIAAAADFDALYALEAMTNARIRDELGEIALVAPEERCYGPGSGPIMAAFTHLNAEGSRFSDGSYGVFYAAREKSTAIAETRYHSARFLRATNEAPITLDMRLYHVEVAGTVVDARALAPHDAILAPDNYAASQAYARRLRERGAAGIVYLSVRETSRETPGECVAAFKPRLLANCRHASQLLYLWDGERIADVYEKL
jgi:hypothetical protein